MERCGVVWYKLVASDDLVAYCSMRVLGAARVEEAWTEEQLAEQTVRTLKLLSGISSVFLDPLSVQSLSLADRCPAADAEPSALNKDLRLSPAAFAFSFPLMKAILTDKSSSESMRTRALDFIEYHLDTEIISVSEH
jgi:hypothetical protein